MRDVFTTLLRELENGRSCELVTILSVVGTAPREPGCTMLIGEDGAQAAGTVGGGCIEWQAVKKGSLLLKNKENGEALFEHGCVTEGASCGAKVTLRFTYCDASNTALKRALNEGLQAGSGTLFIPTVGEAAFRIGKRGEAVYDNGTLSLYVPPRDRVLLFGAGHVAQALVPLLKTLGFTVTVFDERKDLADRAHFPLADSLIVGSFSENLPLRTGALPSDYIVIMSATHSSDTLILSHFVDRDYRYIGMLGSRKKAASIRESLIKKGVHEARLNGVHIPIGLSIGARTPEEVALSAAAELVQLRAENRDS